MLKHLLCIILFVLCVEVSAQLPPWHWAVSAASNGNEMAWDVCYDQVSKGCVIGGHFNGNLASVFGISLSAPLGGKDGFVAKYDQSGNVIWAFKIGGLNDDEVRSVATDPQGNVYVSGYFRGTCDFDPSSSNFNLTPAGLLGSQDGFLAKYDEDGKFLWAVKFGNSGTETVWRMHADANGAYITGSYQNSTTFYSTTSAVKTLTQNIQLGEFYGVKYNSSGVVQWAIAGVSNKEDIGYDVVADENNVYFIGVYGQDLNIYNASGLMVKQLADAGGSKQDAFVLAMTQSGDYTWATNIVSKEDDRGLGIAQSGADIYVTGCVRDDADFKFPNPQFTQTHIGGEDMFVARMSKTTGDFIWVSSQTGSTNGNETGYALRVDTGARRIIVAGSFMNAINYSAFGGPNLTTLGGEDAILTCFEESGNFVWVKHIAGPGTDAPYGLAINPSGGIYTAGEYANSLSVGPISLLSGLGNNIFTAKTGCEVPYNNMISSSQDLCTGTTPATLIGTEPSVSYGYRWKMSANSATWTNASGTYTNQNYGPPVLSNTMYYKREVVGSCSNVAVSPVVTLQVFQHPTTAYAGINQTVCANACTITGNIPLIGSGNWSVLSGTANISSGTAYMSRVTELSEGPNIFQWKISNGPCPPSMSSVLVHAVSPITAFAGSDQQICETNTVAMNANAAQGYGVWSVVAGSGNGSSIYDPKALLSGIGYGTNQFLWTVSKPFCPVTKDTVTITRFSQPSAAYAGEDINVEATWVQLDANPPSVGTGSWTLIDGKGTPINALDPKTLVKQLDFGNTVMRWTVTNGNCAASSDDIVIHLKPFHIPNGFSPNTDGLNDDFKITSLEYYDHIKFSVFNRWGSLVYKNENYKNDWKGTNMSDQKLVDDTYYYVLEIPEYKSLSGFIVIKQDK